MSPATAPSRSTRSTVTAPARPRHQPAPAPARRHLRPVPDTAPARQAGTRRRVRPRVALTLATVAFFLILFGVALLQTVLVQGQLRLDTLRADVAERQATAQTLRNDVAEKGSPQNLRQAAIDQGLTDLGPPRFLAPPSEATSPSP